MEETKTCLNSKMSETPRGILPKYPLVENFFFKIKSEKLNKQDILERQIKTAIKRIMQQTGLKFLKDVKAAYNDDDFIKDKATVKVSFYLT